MPNYVLSIYNLYIPFVSVINECEEKYVLAVISENSKYI